MVDGDDGLERNFRRYDRTESFVLTDIQVEEDRRVPVALEERVGYQLWVRRLDDGEPEPTEPIVVEHGDIIIPFTPIHSTSVNTTPTPGDTTGFVIAIPLIEVRRDDEAKVVFARTWSVVEPKPAERVRLPVGYQLNIDLVLELDWIDQIFPAGDDGYAPLTNTIWTWMTIFPVPAAETLTRYLLAAARRLDAAHRSFERIRKRINGLNSDGPGTHTRLAIFEIVGDIETTIVALSRAIDMAAQVGKLSPISTPVPASLTVVAPSLTKIRNAYEHIEDRALGNINRRPDPQQALTIFDWTSLFNNDAITYAGERLELSEVPGLLLDTRAFLKEAAPEGKEQIGGTAVPEPT